jgi:hypothetical protein
MDVRHTKTFVYILDRVVKVSRGYAEACSNFQDKANMLSVFDYCNKLVWEDINAIKMHLIKRCFVKGYKTWSHHGEAESTFNNADIGMKWVMKMQMKMIMS